MSKPTCKVDGVLAVATKATPGGMCDSVGVQLNDGPSRCHSGYADMCKHSSVCNENLIPNPCRQCKTEDHLFLQSLQKWDGDEWRVVCPPCHNVVDVQAPTKEEAIAAWNKANSKTGGHNEH